jgi:hypothetical protein
LIHFQGATSAHGIDLSLINSDSNRTRQNWWCDPKWVASGERSDKRADTFDSEWPDGIEATGRERRFQQKFQSEVATSLLIRKKMPIKLICRKSGHSVIAQLWGRLLPRAKAASMTDIQLTGTMVPRQ